MKTCLIAVMLSCISASALAKPADVAIGDCTDSMMAVVVDAARGAGETVPAIDSEPMQKVRNGFNDLCSILYNQGLAARSARIPTMARADVKRSLSASIAANMTKQIPAAVIDRMSDIATDAFMNGYSHHPEAD